MNIKALIKSLLRRRFATALLLLQLGLTLGLIVNSLVLALDTQEKLNHPLGFEQERLLSVRLTPTSAAFDDQDFYHFVIEQDVMKLKALSGVEQVSPINQLPIQRGGWNGTVFPLGNENITETDRLLNYVPFYFSNYQLQQTLGMKLVAGRGFDENSPRNDNLESIQSEPELLINQALANKLFAGKSAVGELLNLGRVIGVTSDIQTTPGRPDDKQYAIFMNGVVALKGAPLYYLIRVKEGAMAQVKQQVRQTILAVNPERDVMTIESMAERLDVFYQQDQGLVGLFSLLCGLMVIVTAVSSFAHAQFHISKQKRQIGIRRALGATRKGILLYVLCENWLLTLGGALVGVLFVGGINLGLSSQLMISKPGGLVCLAAFGVIFLSGSIATWLPAWRTSLIPPVIATRTV